MKTLLAISTILFLSTNASFTQTILWDRTYGGTDLDRSATIVASPDGGYLLGGWSGSGIGYEKSQQDIGLQDYWIIKVDAQGNKQWDRIYSGKGVDSNGTGFERLIKILRMDMLGISVSYYRTVARLVARIEEESVVNTISIRSRELSVII